MRKYPKKLIFFGDSGVYGWGDTERGGWCERLRQEWMKVPNAPVIYSLGIRGDGLESVAKRWKQEWNCRGELRRSFPNGLVISVGINDSAKVGSPKGRSQLSAEAFRFGLKQLLTEIKAETDVMVMGITAVDESAMPFAECLWYTNEAGVIYEAQIEETCLELDIPFLALHKEMSSSENYLNLLEPDGIHLNSEGHQWIFSKLSIWKALLKWAELDIEAIATVT